jgi:hypothetical protein
MKRNTKKSTKRNVAHKLSRDKDSRINSPKVAKGNCPGLKDKHKIVDVPFSYKKTAGSNATCGVIDFHYQNYSNVMDFFHVIDHPSVCFFKEGRAFLTLQIENMKRGIYPFEHNDMDFRRNVVRCLQSPRRFVPIILNLVTDEGNHANILLLDSKEKIIELYEPHGSRNSSSCLGGIVGAYRKKIGALRRYWKEMLPEFKIINVVDYRKGTAFQVKYDPDNHSGFCITWTILFVHYRLLNPHVELPSLIKYISCRIKTSKLLQYAKYVEDNIKGKIKG